MCLKSQIVTLSSVDSKVSLSSSYAVTLQLSPVQPLYRVCKWPADPSYYMYVHFRLKFEFIICSKKLVWILFFYVYLYKSIFISSWVLICRTFTLFSKSLPLDAASRVWDVFCRDGEAFLFRAALGEYPALLSTVSSGQKQI